MKKRTKLAPRSRDIAGEPARPIFWVRIEAFLERRGLWLSFGLALIATIRIISTYATFSYTFDEPAHIACGMEWLEKHTYTYEAQHPPLTRVMIAVLPRLAGAHGWNKPNEWDEGLAILFDGGKPDSTLALARAGVLPFFWITCWIAFCCARWISGRTSAAVLAVFLVTMTPTILAHAGLATTDLGLTAMLLLAIYTGWRWLEEPVWWRAAGFGASLGLAVLAKFSTLAFLPSVALVALGIWCWFERPTLKKAFELIRVRGLQAICAFLIAGVVIWTGYRFSFGKTPELSFSVPAPELFKGIQEVRKHNETGHLTYLLGVPNTVGWPYFYVIALGVKTPLPILALGILGLGLLFSRKVAGTRGWIISSTVLGILIFASFFTQIKIGTRHVLPVVVASCIAGGCAAVWLPQRFQKSKTATYFVALLLLLSLVSSLTAHPDYLAYFNVLAGDKPEAFLVDSDLDWSQDVKRLAKRLKEVGAKEVYFNQYAPGDLPKFFGFPPIRPLDVNGPRPGWNAVSITPMKYGLWGGERYVYDRGFEFWPGRLTPAERVGGGILLFYGGP